MGYNRFKRKPYQASQSSVVAARPRHQADSAGLIASHSEAITLPNRFRAFRFVLPPSQAGFSVKNTTEL